MKKYRPSNGTEGMIFIAQFCETCVNEEFMHTQDDKSVKCGILSLTYICNLDHPKYPSEWTYDQDGKPTCTRYKWRDERPSGAKNSKIDKRQMRLF